MAEGARDEVRYTAFLSYSHKDAAAAGKLHRRLESYRMPKRLAGTEGARGPVPERLAPIFRDREELPAASDLSETVREALAQSGALIILCSPEAAGSLWVAEEIEVFRKLHPDRPILAAILDGDPPDCFPAALRAFGRDGTWHEPLATDLRRGKDGAHLGLLKLVAGITGVGLDALVQRDAARRIRRVMAVTGVALVAMLIMAALAVAALNARAEAERQRAEAEGLVEFMLTDLRERLRGSVGQLRVMSDVNRRALAYYDGQRVEDLSEDSLQRRARVLRAMGEDHIGLGRLTAAQDLFRLAHRTTLELLSRSPNDPDRIFSHAQSEYWVGRVHELRREWSAAQRQFNRYADGAARLIAIDPNNPDYMLEMAWGESNRGIVQRDGFHNQAGAQASFESAIGWFQRALGVRSRAEDALALANAYGDLADTFHLRNLWRRSLEARVRAAGIVSEIHRSDPANVEVLYRLAVADRAVANESALAGDLPVARRFILSALERAGRLTQIDPSNVEWLLFKAKVECNLLSRRLALGVGPSRRNLQGNVRSVIVRLTELQNARVSELSPCLPNLEAG